ncbi:AAA ATPase-like protein [Kribbella antiqua]|uniref:AAA ATPase-like protein n=1 Tax=Kribbella antiqua TaxID=2512217 RepID=A0A4R2I840_9ACTN|nr:LuxR family transcriptional regulator [Kribbella antiqua]TCO40504.1 AAA ATPase-like protein [Kribbella antiqua]
MAVVRIAEELGSTGSARLVGRDHELRLLHDALRMPSGLVLVVGEAGVGKTRLISEVAARHPARWLTAQCRPYEDSAPVVEEVLGSAAGSAVVLIEDIHWASPDALQMLRSFAGRITLVVTYRPEDARHQDDITSLAGSGARTTEVRVDPLDRGAVRELSAQLLGLDLLPMALTDELARHTGGLPFAVEEFLRQVPDGADIEEQVRRALAETPAPVSLRASMAVRLQEVPDSCRRVVCAAAVLATAAPENLLGAVSGITRSALTDAVDRALARGLLHEARPGLYDLRHPLARRAVRATIPPDEVRRLHRQAATALAEVEPPPHARIAGHFRRGGVIDGWLTHAELAADQSADAEQYAAMLQVEALPWADRARLAAKLGRTALAGPQWQDAVTTVQAVLAEFPARSTARGRLRLALGLLLHDRAGDIPAGRRELTAAIDELAEDPASAAWAMSALAVPIFGTEPIFEHRAWMQRALSLVGDAPDAAVRINQARFRLALGEVDVVEGFEVAGALAWLGHARRASALLERSDDSAVAAVTRLRLAFHSGDWAVIAEQLTRARAAAAGLPLVQAEVDLIDARLRLAQGDVAAGKELLASVVTRTELGPLPVHAAASAALAHDLDRCLALVRRKSGWVSAGDLIVVTCTALLHEGRTEDARRLATEFTAIVSGLDAPAATAAALHAEAVVQQSVSLFSQAAARYRAIGRQYDECVVLEQQGLLLLAQGNQEPLKSTARAYEAMGAHGDARRCQDALRAAGVAVPRSRGRRGYGNTLSPRELEVARLAAEGLTNAQIAATLGLTVSTVEDHVSRALRKLGLTSRHALGPHVR